MKKQSHTVPRRRQSASPASRHLPFRRALILLQDVARRSTMNRLSSTRAFRRADGRLYLYGVEKRSSQQARDRARVPRRR